MADPRIGLPNVATGAEAAQAERAASERVAVVRPDGKLVSIPVSSLGEAQARGYKVGGADVAGAVVARDRQRDAGSLGGMLATAAESAAAGAIDIGAAPVALSAAAQGKALDLIGGALEGAAPEAASGLRAVAREMGQFGGDISGRRTVEGLVGLASGGLGGFVEGSTAYAKGAQERAAENPWTAFGARLAPQLAAGIASGSAMAGLGRGAALGASALEGALQGGAEAHEQAYLRGRQSAAAEAVLGDGLFGAVLGAAAHGATEAIPAAGRYLLGSGRARAAAETAAGAAPEASVAARAAENTVQSGPVSAEAAGKVAETVLGVPPAPGLAEAIAADAADAVRLPGGARARSFPEFVAAWGKNNAERLNQWSAGLRGDTVENTRLFAPWNLGAESRRARKLAMNADAIADDAVREITDDLRTINAHKDVVFRDGVGDGKLAGVDKLLDDGVNPNLRMAALGEQFDSAARALSPEAIKAESAAGRRALESARRYVNRQTDALASAGSIADAYKIADDTKRALQKMVKHADFAASKQADAIAGSELQSLAQHLEREVQEPMRQFLMNEDVWGKAGRAQRDVNASFKRHIDVQTPYQRSFEESVGKAYRAGMGGNPDIMRAATGKVESFVNGLGTAGKRDAEEALGEHVASTLQLAEDMLRHYDLPAADAKRVRAMRDAAVRLQKRLDDVGETLRLRNQFKEFKSKTAGEGTGAMIAASGLGNMLGPVGWALGAGAHVVANPGAYTTNLLRVATVLETSESRTAKALRRFLRIGEDGAPGPGGARPAGGSAPRQLPSGPRAPEQIQAGAPLALPPSPAPRQMGPSRGRGPLQSAAERVVVGAGLVPFGSDRRKRADAYRAAAGRVAQLASSPEFQASEAARATEALSGYAPGTAAAAAQTMARGVEYLNSILPSGTQDGGLTPQLTRLDASDAQISRWGLAYQTVTNPASVLDDLARGTLAPEQRDALKAVYPETYATLQRQTLEALSEATEPVPYQRALQLGMLLELGGGAHPALDPGFQQRLASAAQSTSAPAEPPRMQRPPRVSQRHRTNDLEELQNA